MKKIVLTFAALTLVAMPVLAQTTTTMSPAAANYMTVSKDEIFASKLKGINVYNSLDETIGEITDIAFKGKDVNALILSVGGFLGVGERYVAVAPESVMFSYEAKTRKWKAMINAGKDTLKEAPEFKYPTK